MNIQTKKLNIIELIISINDDSLLDALEKEALGLIEYANKKPDILEATKPIQENVTLDQMVKEQNTQSMDAETFFSLASEVELNEPIDDLLADLTR